MLICLGIDYGTPTKCYANKVQEANLAVQHDDPSHMDILTRWRDLQTSVNLFYDSSKGLG